MKITWLGHSCFKVESDGYSAVLDPYADGSVPGLGDVRETADIVLCSHGHDDHNAAGNVNLCGSGAAPFDVSFIDTWHDNMHGKMRGSNRITILSDGKMTLVHLSLIHISEPTRPGMTTCTGKCGAATGSPSFLTVR